MDATQIVFGALVIMNTLWRAHSSKSVLTLECDESYITAESAVNVSQSGGEEVIFFDLHNVSRDPPSSWYGLMPCSCSEFNCGCCAGIRFQTFSIDQSACMNFTYDPYEFSLDANLIMNGESVYQNKISGRDPPPACVYLPIILLNFFNFCARFFNVFTPGTNFHFCMDFEVRLQSSQLFVLHFNCIRMGINGIALLKPEDNGGLDSLPSPAVTSGIDTDIDIPYDEVTEDRKSLDYETSFENSTGHPVSSNALSTSTFVIN